MMSLAMMMFQDAGTSQGDLHWIMIGVLVLSFISLVQFLAFVIGGLQAMKTVAEMKTLAHDLHGKTAPLLAKTHALVEDLTPKVQAISTNVEQVSYTVREKVDELSVTVSELNRTIQDVNVKTRGQVAHVDRIVSSALTTSEEIATTVTQGIRGPVKQVAGVVAGLKTGMETLVRNFSRGRGNDMDL